MTDGGVVDGACFDVAGVAGEEGFADAAFVIHSFVAAEWFGVGVFAVGAVVGGEDDEGVFGEFEVVEGFEDLADGLVHGFDHGGVFGVFVCAMCGLLFVFGGEFFGGLDGGVDGVEGEVDEEGGFGVFGDPVGEVSAETFWEVLAFGAVFEVGVFIGREVGFRVSPSGAAEVGVEAVFGGIYAEMPFSGDAGAVALRF